MPIKRFILIPLITVILFLTATTEVFSQRLATEKSKQDSIVQFAEKFIGTAYLYGGCSPEGFDCSGFVYYVYSHFDLEVPRSSADYEKVGMKICMEAYRKGDIILFTGTNYDHSVVGHVGIIISSQDEPLRFIHSSSSKRHWGVTITDFQNSGYPERLIGIRRL